MIVVCGSIHSGTSKVAQALQKLGVDMGEFMEEFPLRCEDKIMACGTIEEKIAHIKQKENTGKLYGYKFPVQREWFKQIQPYLTNVKYLFCYRDPFQKTKYAETELLREHFLEGAFWVQELDTLNNDLLVVNFDWSESELLKHLMTFLKDYIAVDILEN